MKYYSGASGGTDAVTAGTYKLSNVAAGTSQYIHFVVTAATNARSGTSRGFRVTAISAADTTKRDAVKASVSVPQARAVAKEIRQIGIRKFSRSAAVRFRAHAI